MVSDAVNYKQKDQKLHDWLVGVDLDEAMLYIIRIISLIPHWDV